MKRFTLHVTFAMALLISALNAAAQTPPATAPTTAADTTLVVYRSEFAGTNKATALNFIVGAATTAQTIQTWPPAGAQAWPPVGEQDLADGLRPPPAPPLPTPEMALIEIPEPFGRSRGHSVPGWTAGSSSTAPRAGQP